MDTNVSTCFSKTYPEARRKFLDAAARRGLDVETHVLPDHMGRHGEPLATDIVWLGAEDAERLLIVTSAIHGVEGYCGSGCQVAMLNDDWLLGRARDLDVAIAIVHAVNPHGFSYDRRVNEDNIDVNRNFHDFSAALPQNPAYEELVPFVLPASWPPDADSARQLAAYVEAHGADAFGQALFRSQYAHPNGMFFGGTAPTWSNNMVRRFLRERAGRARQIGWIDLHTGLGPRGHCEKVFIGGRDEFATAQQWWGNDVISPSRSDSVMFEIRGPMLQVLREECPQANIATIALEFGTVELMRMLEALRADHWCWKHREPEDTDRREAARVELRNAFFVEEEDWFGMVVGQFRTATVQSLLGLNAEKVREVIARGR
jgi:predicted deacylase